uniref:Uncharacterized protein n=1 Tax=Panagrolaimus sp. JU765 TaxID=591449 RepID=A0AC34RA33_9BILA
MKSSMQQDLDLRGLKYVERNGGCYMDLYKIYLNGTADPFPIETYYSNCYYKHSVHGYNILAKWDGKYRLAACFYFNENQTVKCQKLHEKVPKFDEYINVACNNEKMRYAEQLIFTVGEEKYGTVHIYNRNIGDFDVKDGMLPIYMSFTYIGNFVSLKLTETVYRIEWEKTIPRFTKNVAWTQKFDFIFPLDELENKTILHVERNYTGIKYVNETSGCLVKLARINNVTKKQEIPIDCFPKDAVHSFGMVHDFNGKYRLRTCYLIYENIIPEMTCYVLENDGKFKKELDYMFQNCAFVAGYIDDKHCEQYPETLPKIIIKEYNGTKNNGITINYYKTNCEISVYGLEAQKDATDKEVDGIKIYGYDPIRDLVFTADTLSSYGYKDVEQVFSTGDTLFFKLNGKMFESLENGQKKNATLDFDAIVDERLFGDDFFLNQKQYE